MTQNNPLLEDHTLPPFDSILPEHVVPAITSLIRDAEAALEQQLSRSSSTPTWGNLVAPIEEWQDRINKAWGPVCHLNAVVNNDALRKAYEETEQKLTQYYTAFGQNKVLYDAYVTLHNSQEFSQLSQPQKQTITNAIRDFELSGVSLSDEKKSRYGDISAKLSSLSTQFSNNVLDATRGWEKHITDVAELVGMPEHAIEAAAQTAQQKSLEGYVLTLDIPVYLTVMTQSENPELRKELYTAFSTRASSEGPCAGQWDNTQKIDEILALKKEKAQLLGFNNYAELSIKPKMAESCDQVVAFLTQLAEKSRPIAEKELEELNAFAKEHYQVETLNAWDVAFYSEKLKIEKYAISQEAVRPYFPVHTFLKSLFTVAQKLFGLDIREGHAETWHEDVKYYEIYRDTTKIACFYFDVFAREHKRGGAWMADCRVRRINEDGDLQLPTAFLVCNFNGPVKGKPALLTHNDVTTLFHEFGHGIHHMLTKIDVASVSGISGVAWDAVELPSQFMENYCWEKDVLAFLSGHYETGESLPQDMLEKMLAAKNFQSAMQMVRQLEFSLFDFLLHMEFGTEKFLGVQQLLDSVRARVSVLMPPSFNKFQNSFSHIFAGGYSAGYYSYKWAEVLSADAYSAFEEAGIFDSQTGQRYLTEILEKGGSEEAMVLFKNFRGREPNIEALLRHSGIGS